MPIPWGARSAEKRAQYNAQRKLTRKPTPYRKLTPEQNAQRRKPFGGFIAVDGEGLNRDDGSHDYVLLAASDHTSIERWDVGGIATAACFDYLLALHERNPNATLIAFSFGYDVNMMLRDVTRAQLERINESEYTTIGSYRVRYVPGKSFYVARGGYDASGKWRVTDGVTVWDVWGFFQSSFVKAISEWKIAAPESIDIIARMKDKRGDFDADMQGLITAYCFRECDLLVQVMDEFKRVSDAAGIALNRWDGAGACAAALLRSRGMAAHIAPSRTIPEPVERAALYAYFGGRIEIYGSGVVPTAGYEYDINSAYPAEIAKLPSLFGSWRRVIHPNVAALNEWGLYRVVWDVRAERSLIGPFPWRRDDGAIIYPLRGEGYYHAVEVAAALALYVGITVPDGYEYTPDTDDKPFSWVNDLYAQRRVYKEAGDARHIVIKLALNAMYGKLAQSVGFNRDKPPAFQSFYLAGRVTAGTRAKILAALRMAGDAVVSAMTDAVFLRERTPYLTLGTGLGEWDEQELAPGLLVVQPGVVLTPESTCAQCAGAGCYACKDGAVMAFGRSRGFHRASLNYGDALRAWQSSGFIGAFSVRERRFIGMGRALAAARLYDWHLDYEPERDMFGNLISQQWRRWVEIEKRISFFANTGRKDTGASSLHWQTWLPPDDDNGLSARYTPKNIYRVIRDIEAHDAVEQNEYTESVGIL